MSSFWNEKTEAKLVSLATGKLTAAQIGTQLGISRNAVIGKLLRGKGKFGRVTDGTAPRANKKQPLEAKSAARAQKAVEQNAADSSPAAPLAGALENIAAPVFSCEDPARQVTVPAALPVLAPISFSDAVDENRCLFFSGDPYAPSGPDMPVCGQVRAKVPGTRYCRHHLVRRAAEKVAA